MQTVDTEAVAAVLAEQLEGRRPRVLLTLGSGLGGVADGLDDPVVIANDRVGLPDPTVPGHAGRLIAGRIEGVEVLVQQGRVHLYEGAGVATVTACVDAAAALGIEVFVVTNAAGGLNQSFAAGDLMLITDQLNLTGHSPLVGLARPHFLDMKDCYDPTLQAAARVVADRLGHRIVEGVYAGLVGPAYETPAEVRMLATLGADAVGMSTVTEVIAARAAGLRVLGFSLVTNVHRPGGTPTAHEEVLEASAAAGPRLADIVRAVVAELGP
jgi:purine-nucleoside phosphorylase